MEYDEFNVYKEAFKDTIPSKELDKKIMESLNKDINSDNFDSEESVIEFPKPKRKWIYVAAAIFVICAFSALGIMVGIKGKLKKIEREDLKTASEDTGKSNKKCSILDQEYTTFALYGVDCREDGDIGRSDSIVIISLNNKTKKINFISVDRDLLVNCDGKYSVIKNEYSSDGYNLATQTLNNNLDLKIDYYVEFNFKTIVYLTDLVGGIELNINSDELLNSVNKYGKEFADINNISYKKLEKQGIQTLDGCQTLGYVRTRKIDNEDARMQRIREVMQKMFTNVTQTKIIETFIKENDTLDTILSLLKTNLSDDEIIELSANFSKYSIGECSSFPFSYEMATNDYNLDDTSSYHMACIISSNLKDDITKLHNKLYPDEKYTTSEFINNMSDHINSVNNNN